MFIDYCVNRFFLYCRPSSCRDSGGAVNGSGGTGRMVLAAVRGGAVLLATVRGGGVVLVAVLGGGVVLAAVRGGGVVLATVRGGSVVLVVLVALMGGVWCPPL